jgi:hypothetical protein
MATFHEDDNTADTVSFTGCTDSTLTFDLANSDSSYTISESESLHLQLKHTRSALSVTFQYDSAQWPSTSTLTVALDDGGPQQLPVTFTTQPTGSVFSITVTTGSSGELGIITWDPKIKVIPPIRTK